jgi:hypothetical protein
MTRLDPALLIEGYERTAAWLHDRAVEYESGKARHLAEVHGEMVDFSEQRAAEFRHLAGNLSASVQAFRRMAERQS